MSTGIILFGHGARSPEWADPFHRIRASIVGRDPDAQVELGFLELMRPTLDEAIDTLVAKGLQRINIVPIFMAAGSHVKKDLPLLAANAMERHPGVTIDIAAPVGEAVAVIDAMAEYAMNQR